MSRIRFWSGLTFCLLGIALLLGLGTWQMERLHWKEGLIARIESRIHSTPESLAKIRALENETGDVDYRPVTVSGRFLHEGEAFILSTYDGQAGWNVFTPLLTGDNDLVFVNRGFVPYDMRDPKTRTEGQISGSVTFDGVARNAPSEKPGYFVPDSDSETRTFFWRDLDGIAGGLTLEEHVSLLPFFIDAGAETPWGPYPIGGQTQVTITNNHLQYAITWYGLAFVLIVMTGMLIHRYGRRTP